MRRIEQGRPFMDQVFADQRSYDRIAELASDVLCANGTEEFTRWGGVTLTFSMEGDKPDEVLHLDYDEFPGRGSRLDVTYEPGGSEQKRMKNMLATTGRSQVLVRTIAIDRAPDDPEPLLSLDRVKWTATQAKRITGLLQSKLFA